MCENDVVAFSCARSALVIAAVVAGVVAVVESVVVAGEEEKRGWRSDGVCNGRWWGVSEWTE